MAKERNILITGAGSGVGRGLGLFLARRGHLVMATDLDEAAARETADRIAEAGGRARAHRLDVTSAPAVEALMAELGDRAVDVLINNAGLQHVAKLEDFPQEQWDRIADVVLKGACLMTRAVLPGMRARGFGRIVNIGSIHSLVASPCKTAYVAAKHGLAGFSKVVALETADVDITINTICPSYIRTPLVEKQIKAQAAARGIPEDEVVQRIMLEPMPKKKFVTIEEVAATVEFFMGDAAGNITGQTLAIDGGWTAQ
jgi:3-hydroxybutyrate dehydrogenase